MEMLAEHGIAKPVEAVGLTDEQIVELKIQDLWTPKCYPSGGSVYNRDDIGRRTGNGTCEMRVAGSLRSGGYPAAAS